MPKSLEDAQVGYTLEKHFGSKKLGDGVDLLGDGGDLLSYGGDLLDDGIDLIDNGVGLLGNGGDLLGIVYNNFCLLQPISP